MTLYHRWFCRACRQSFNAEAAVIKHITETGHTALSYQRFRPRSR